MAGFGRYSRKDSSAAPSEPRVLPPASASELLQYAYAVLSQRALSEREMQAKLEHKLSRSFAPLEDEMQSEMISGVLKKLKDYRFVDDSRLAESLSRTRGVGSYRIRAKMYQRGIDDETGAKALKNVDPELEKGELERLVERNWDRWQAAGPKGHARAYGFLARRGFSSRDILKALVPLQPIGQSRGQSKGSSMELDSDDEDE